MSPSTPNKGVTPLLDHIVILIPHSFLTSPPAWFGAPLFTFAPGGRHADGLTENVLVLFADGSYLEFIAFVPPPDNADSQRRKHRWGRKTEGTVIDWALTLHASGDDDYDGDGGDGGDGKGGIKHGAEFREIQDRVEKAGVVEGGTGIVYADPARGGRLRPDGVELRWAVASAKRRQEGEEDRPVEPGQLPFWCLDETPRRLRVPFEEHGGDKTRHPTGVVGVAEVEVGVASGTGSEGGSGQEEEKEKEKEALAAAYGAVFGGKKPGKDGWEVETIAGGSDGGGQLHPPGRVVLSTQEGDGSGDGSGAGGSIKITFYTDDENWAGKTIGGKVDDEHTLEFKLVAATAK